MPVAYSPLAVAVLVAWIPLTIVLFSRMAPARAAAISLVVGVYFLPAAQGVTLPLLPDLERRTIPPLAILLATAMQKRPFLREVRIGKLNAACFALLIISDIARVLANRDPLHYGGTHVDGLVLQNIITFWSEDALLIGVMFYSGAAIGRSPEGLRAFLKTWLAVALLYIPLAAIEVRLSPRVNLAVYGYFQHDFMQMVRSGGYRPIVFMGHGLELALALAGSALVALSVSGSRMRILFLGVRGTTWALFGLLSVCKSAAAMSYGFGGLILQKFFSPGLRVTIARLIALTILIYPIMRLGGWLNATNVGEAVSVFGEERTGSLVFRLDNEDRMLVKAMQRPWTGWGGFARYFVYDSGGRSLTVPDGSWIIEFASGGVPRFVAMFGLFAIQVFGMKRTIKLVERRQPRDAQLFGTLCLASVFLAFDLIPNSFFNYMSYTAVGILSGISTRIAHDPVAYWPVISSASDSVSSADQAPKLPALERGRG
jgi:hypothetical protein